MIIGIDVDSVVADLDKAWFARYNQDYNDDLQHEDITDWATHTFVVEACGYKIYDYLKDPTLYDDVKPIKDSLEVINWLRDLGHRVVFVTTTPIETPGVKFNWLVKYGYLKENQKGDYFEATDKSLIRIDLLLDDRFSTIESFPGVGVVFNQPWNSRSDQYWKFRANDWLDFQEKFHEGIYFHPTLLKRPEQVAEFDRILAKMRQVHLDKNADYSPANILGCGEIGLVTRIWDKVSRLMNLSGFRIEIASSSYEKPITPKNESIEDTLTDLAVYGIIGLILRKGKWGK